MKLQFQVMFNDDQANVPTKQDFDEYDMNSDGIVTFEELMEIAEKVMTNAEDSDQDNIKFFAHFVSANNNQYRYVNIYKKIKHLNVIEIQLVFSNIQSRKCIIEMNIKQLS